MSVRMRHTKGHTGNRRSHHALEATTVVKDATSGNLRLPHRLDEATGMYRGKQIAPAIVKKVSAKAKSAKGVSTEPVAERKHEHAHEEHANAGVKAVKGIKEAGRPKSRSGFGGGA